MSRQLALVRILTPPPTRSISRLAAREPPGAPLRLSRPKGLVVVVQRRPPIEPFAKRLERLEEEEEEEEEETGVVWKNPSYHPDQTRFVLHFDGSSKGNPGPSGAGWVLSTPEGHCVAHESFFVGPNHTNNEAEYIAFIRGMDFFINHVACAYEVENEPTPVLSVYGDSKLVVEQTLQRWQCRAPHLLPLQKKAIQHWNEYTRHSPRSLLEHIPRAQNKQADELSNWSARMETSRQMTFPWPSSSMERVSKKRAAV